MTNILYVRNNKKERNEIYFKESFFIFATEVSVISESRIWFLEISGMFE